MNSRGGIEKFRVRQNKEAEAVRRSASDKSWFQ
jgi:hypothetical protein